jgi:hypothetical protein
MKTDIKSQMQSEIPEEALRDLELKEIGRHRLHHQKAVQG